MKNTCDFEGICELVARKHQVTFELYRMYACMYICNKQLVSYILKFTQSKYCHYYFFVHAACCRLHFFMHSRMQAGNNNNYGDSKLHSYFIIIIHNEVIKLLYHRSHDMTGFEKSRFPHTQQQDTLFTIT